MRNAYNPMVFSPCAQDRHWEECKGNEEISAKLCKALLPDSKEHQKYSLAELINLALLNSPATKKTWADAQAAAALYGQALSPYFPTVDINSSITRSRTVDFEENALGKIEAETNLLSTVQPAEVNLSYTIFDFGLRQSSSESARQTLFYADWTHNQEIQTVIQKIMKDYYDCQYQKQSVIAFEKDLENAQTSLDAAENKFKSGVAPLGDVVQAKTQYLQIEMDLIAQKKLMEQAFALLVKDVGIPVTFFFEIQEFPEQVSTEILLEDVNTLVAQAKKKRQNFLAAQANLRAKEEQIKVAQAEGAPSLDTTFNIGKNIYVDKAHHNEHEDYHFSLALELSFPLFQGFYYKNGIRNAQANLEGAFAHLKEVELTLIEEVTNAHTDVLTAAETLKYSEEYLLSAKQRYEITFESYKAGTMTILDLLSAQTSLTDARARRANAYKEWYTALASLAYSTGNLCATGESL